MAGIKINTANTDYLSDVTTPLNFNSPYSVLMHRKVGSSTGTFRLFHYLFNITSGGEYDGLGIDSADVLYRLESYGAPTGAATTTGGTQGSAGTWEHMAHVRSGTAAHEMFKNGGSVITDTANVASRGVIEEEYLGIVHPTLGFGDPASFAGFMEFTGALTAAQILAQSRSMTPILPGLYRWVPGMIAGSLGKDFSPNARNFTVNGSPSLETTSPLVAWKRDAMMGMC